MLRGQNCRFQLFGDTVNVASRMESNGRRNDIHISEETAFLITAAGKEHWLIPREDKIHAKGKGELTTFWLKSRKASGGSVTTSGSDSVVSIGETDATASTGGSVSALSKRLRRLVTFNSDLLERLLKSVVARRDAEILVQKCSLIQSAPQPPVLKDKSVSFSIEGGTVLDEVQDIVALPKFNAKAAMKQQDPKDVVLNEAASKQLHEYVTVLATMYRKDVPFHNVSLLVCLFA